MIDELLWTLDIARKCFPSDVHPVHIARLKLIERMVKRALEAEPAHWQASFDQAEQIADDVILWRLVRGNQPNADDHITEE